MGRKSKNIRGKKKTTAMSVSPAVPPQSKTIIVADSLQTIDTDVNESANSSQTTICVSCKTSGPAGTWLVQCDDCDRYFHYECVGFKEMSKDDPWSCPECVKKVLTSTARSNGRDSYNDESDDER